MRFVLCLLACLIFVTRMRDTSAETVELTGNHGVLSTAGFPQPYPDNVNKTWIITVRTHYRVRLYFTTFDLEDSYDEEAGGACVYDFVQISGNSNRFCGNARRFPVDAPRIGQVFVSDGNVMTVNHVSDYSNDDPKPIGFEAHFIEEDANECYDLKNAISSGGEGWDEIIYCNHFCHNTPGSYYCSCRPGFVLHENHHTCVAICDSESLMDAQGVLTSADYPLPYSKLSDCEKTIEAVPGKRVDIRFDPLFVIEDHYEDGCVYDWLQLTDDNNREHRYCGTSAPYNGTWSEINSRRMRVFFHSDLSVEKSGYKIYYRTTRRVQCTAVFRAPTNGRIIRIPNKPVMEFEDEIEFACNRGYRMEGISVTTCIEDGSWSEDAPTCHIKYCPRPDHLLNVVRTIPVPFEETERPYGSRITINCTNEWYGLVSGTSEWFCDDDQTWNEFVLPSANNSNNNLPECRPYCGVKNRRDDVSFLDQHILGGREAIFGEFPWMAFIDLGRGLRGDAFCGGSLVDEQFIVTAAHCLAYTDQTIIQIYLGMTDRHDDNNPYLQRFTILEMTLHPRFVAAATGAVVPQSLIDHDIAIIKLNRPAVIGQFVRPLCIPRSILERNLPQNQQSQASRERPARGVVAGWGITTAGTPSQVLRLVRVPYVNHTFCRQTYHEQSVEHASYGDIDVTDNQFCAGFINKAKDSCNGDSGGPLMWRKDPVPPETSGRWYLNGIVSFGTSLGSCQFFVIGVYTNVSSYVEFLDNHILLT